MANGYPNRQVFAVSFASNTRTATINLGDNGWKKVFFDARAMGAQLAVQCSWDGTAFGPLLERVPNTASVQFQAVTLASTVSGGWAPLNLNSRFVQFVATATAANGATCYVVCTD